MALPSLFIAAVVGVVGFGVNPAPAQTGSPTTAPAYIIDADGSVVTTADPNAPSTTLIQIDLPGGATTKASKPKRSTTTKPPAKTAAKKAAAKTTTQPPASGIPVGKSSGQPSSTVKPGPGVDPTITTMLSPADVPNSVPDEVWAALRKCESNNRYDINTGNGYYGAYQFAAGTWSRLGYKGLPHQAAPAVQDEAAKRLQAKAGWGQWPACTRKLGLR
jgi:Transglycosylase-like domain